MRTRLAPDDPLSWQWRPLRWVWQIRPARCRPCSPGWTGCRRAAPEASLDASRPPRPRPARLASLLAAVGRFVTENENLCEPHLKTGIDKKQPSQKEEISGQLVWRNATKSHGNKTSECHTFHDRRLRSDRSADYKFARILALLFRKSKQMTHRLHNVRLCTISQSDNLRVLKFSCVDVDRRHRPVWITDRVHLKYNTYLRVKRLVPCSNQHWINQ